MVFGSLEELRVFRRRLLLLPWTPFGAPLWAEGVAGMDSDARRPLYLGLQQELTLP